ncbi:MAG: hypothetical protein ACTSRS_04050 [Candidatus Helarchaeota archaeon]
MYKRSSMSTFLVIIIIFGIGFALIATPSDNVELLGDNGSLQRGAAAIAPLYDRMFYEWTGSWGISGLGSFAWSGYARFSYAGGNDFDVDYYDDFMGAATYSVNNGTRLITSSSSSWNGMHDTLWILSNVSISDTVLIRNQWAVADQTFTVVGEDNRSAMGKVFACWYLTGPSGSWAYYDKKSGLLIDGDFRYYYAAIGYTYFYHYTISKSNAPNYNPPQLLNPEVVPAAGNTTTLFHFRVNYTDADDNEPENINVTIDGVTYAMQKENALDSIYTDGVIYTYSMPMTNTTHFFYFNASDWRFIASTSVINGPSPVNKLSDNPPILTSSELYPEVGHTGVNYRFRVIYSDPDNDIPLFVNVTVNTTTITMYRLDPEDNNYLDGVIYEAYLPLSAAGNYTYFFNASDGNNIIGYPNTTFAGPQVWAPYPSTSPLFNGAYIDYGGDYGGIAWTGRENYTLIAPNKFGCSSTNSYAGSDYRDVNNLTRFFTSQTGLWGNNSYDWTWLFTNLSLTDTVRIAKYQEGYRNFTVTGEATKTQMGQTFICWELSDDLGSKAYYDKALGIFIEGTFFTTGGTQYRKWITYTNIPDQYPPTLTNGTVIPQTGNLSTNFVFQVTYSDPDNHAPVYINLILNNKPHPMTKQDSGDTNYTDGCVYVYSTQLENITYSYYFEASDNHFRVRDPTSGNYSGPIVNRLNANPATLFNAYLMPKYVTKWHTYEFRVTYSDPDNIGPTYVNVTFFREGIPYGTFALNPVNISDTYYVDGADYSISLLFPAGNYTYYYETNDTYYVTRYPNASYFNDLIITNAKTSFFDGFYYTYYVGMWMGYWAEGRVDYTQVGPDLYDRNEQYTAHVGSPITSYYYDRVNATTREIIQSDHGITGQKVEDMIWNNTRVGSTIYMRAQNIPYQIYTCVGSEVITAMGQPFDCWKFQDGGNRIYFEKYTGMFIYSYSDVGMGYSIRTTVTATNMDFTVNDYAPTLSAGNVTPTIGFTNDTYTFQITYTDADNNPPQSIQVLIDGIAYNMIKQNPGDNNYTDGVVYIYSTLVSQGNHTYNFTAFDGAFYANYPPSGSLLAPNVSIPPNTAPPVLQNGQVTPGSGDGATVFIFQVTYRDIENIPPASINVTINGTVYPMIPQDPMDTNYMDGALYNYSTILDPGIYSYYFNASDGDFSAQYPTFGVLTGPNVSNNAPILSDPSVSPSVGNTLMLYNFSVTYTDADNHAPISVNLTIEGVGTYPMAKQNENDSDFTDGCIYSYSTYLAVGNYSYFFQTFDGYDLVRDPVVGSFSGPTVMPPPNQPPILSGGQVIPAEGDPTAIFVFKIIYQDPENTPPSQISVIIDGIPHFMVPADPTAMNFTTGVEYVYATMLTSGSHTYYFTSSDGLNSTRYPEVGVIYGPIFIGEGGGDGTFVLTLAIILAFAMALGIPIAMYIIGRQRRPPVPEPRAKPKGKKRVPRTISQKSEISRHTVAHPTLKLPPHPQPATALKAEPSLPPTTPAPRNPLTEEELKAILKTIRYVSDAEKAKLLEKLKTMNYEQQQAILKALPR